MRPGIPAPHGARSGSENGRLVGGEIFVYPQEANRVAVAAVVDGGVREELHHDPKVGKVEPQPAAAAPVG
ncbi:hypothetical protein J2X68_005034 [Streptomyces sp. 3330]|uniref:hypothetical protein n=1 Tax=Streptomyces sp. 3330 TaxID=2817755 RepID=UPI00285EA4BB|nr:hypothetical protein [Streptomyces sp. 3330]MDR6978308.1 hypothetical protein [Streptomyces sp. 3330]